MAGVKEAYWEKDRQESSERIEGLQSESEKARAAIAESDAKTATANESAARANERTSELKLPWQRKIAARQPRTISAEQNVQIVEYLKTASPKGLISVMWKLFDEEAEKFGKQVISVLRDAGFDATEGRGAFGYGNRGAWILVKDLAKVNSAPNVIGAIQGAFRDVLHIQFDGMERPAEFPDADVTIV